MNGGYIQVYGKRPFNGIDAVNDRIVKHIPDLIFLYFSQGISVYLVDIFTIISQYDCTVVPFTKCVFQTVTICID